MPDIAMCYGTKDDKDCPFRHRCYRFTATPSDFRQAYLGYLPYDPENDDCDHLLDNVDRSVTKLRATEDEEK